MRRIRYLSGTRADFGLMQASLQAIAAHAGLQVDIISTGTHLSERYGLTVRDIEAAALPIVARIPVDTGTASGASMALNLAKTLEGTVANLEQDRPDALLLLGDRGEMLAGALAAVHLNVPIVHVHGGERSGTVDEPVRHAISKLSHYHFVATEQSRDRLIRMGERPDTVFVTGAPGLDGITTLAAKDRATLCAQLGLAAQLPLALFVYHPVVQEAPRAGAEAAAVLAGCLEQGLQIVALRPNSDAGADGVRAALHEVESRAEVRVLTHMPRADYVSWMAVCDVMVGNSSSGIIEAASFGTPVINIGSRQSLRERNANVTDLPRPDERFARVLSECLRQGRLPARNVYGDGCTSRRICDLLARLDLSPAILEKTNAY